MVTLTEVEPGRVSPITANLVIDELLLGRLSAVAMLVDPVPEEVSMLARAAFERPGEPRNHVLRARRQGARAAGQPPR